MNNIGISEAEIYAGKFYDGLGPCDLQESNMVHISFLIPETELPPGFHHFPMVRTSLSEASHLF